MTMNNVNNILLTSATNLKKEGLIDDNVSPDLVMSSIKVAQTQHLQPLIGTRLYYKILDLVEKEAYCEPNNKKYAELLDVYIVDYLNYMTLYELQIPLTYKMRNIGTYTAVNTEGKSVSPIKELTFIRNFYADRGQFYGQRIVDFILANKFTEYSDNKPGDMKATLKPYNTGLNI